MPATLASITPIRPYGGTPETQEPLSHEVLSRANFAHKLTGKLFDWLVESPNNPTYFTSEAYRLPKAWLDEHYAAIDAYLSEEIPSISMGNAAFDLYYLDMIRDPNAITPLYNSLTEQVEPRAKMFDASYFLNAGIEDTLAEARANTLETPRAVANERTVRAIGSMLTRSVYFTQLSRDNPEHFLAEERDRYLATFRQNIISAVRSAALLEKASLSAQSPAQTNAGPALAVA